MKPKQQKKETTTAQEIQKESKNAEMINTNALRKLNNTKDKKNLRIYEREVVNSVSVFPLVEQYQLIRWSS